MATGRIETFLFDLDGTLIDSIELIFASYKHTLREHRGLEVSDADLLRGLGTPLWAHLGAYSDDPDEVEAMSATYRDHNAEHHDALVRPYEGTHAAVLALRERGHRLGIVTSKRRSSTFRGLELCGFDPGLFEVLICADDVDVHKPEPGPVLAALDALGAKAASTLFTGDSPHDLESGQRAGVATAAVAWGPFPDEVLVARGPDYWLGAPDELVAVASGERQPTFE